jgi:ornithine cyclodeaminase/alanine dehydrogenase-like protein (mu-crystallin family)
MTGPTLRFTAAELYGVLSEIDPLGVLAEELVARSTHETSGGLDLGSRLTVGPDENFALFEDPSQSMRSVLPTAALRAGRTAALAALAARELVVPGVVTAAVLGSGSAAQLLLAVIARHVPGVSYVAASPDETHPVDGNGSPLAPQLLQQLDLAGIDLTVTRAVDEAVRGANLVIAATGVPGSLAAAQLSRGSLLINAAGVDLPDAIVDDVDDIYVDDVALLEANRHRVFVRTHLDGAGDPARWGEDSGWRQRQRIKADLRQLLAGEKSGRTNVDDVLLVELLGVRELDVRFASTLHRAAVDRGFGAPMS